MPEVHLTLYDRTCIAANLCGHAFPGKKAPITKGAWLRLLDGDLAFVNYDTWLYLVEEVFPLELSEALRNAPPPTRKPIEDTGWDPSEW
jgi:hypothetical protein